MENLIEKARLNYLPQKINLLLVAEAPPKNINHFFYFSYVPKGDYLFLAILKAFGSEKDKKEYLKKKRRGKEQWLRSIQEQGIYLIDISDKHIGKHPLDKEKQKIFIEKLDALIKLGKMDKKTPIILIKKNVYKSVCTSLKRMDYNVINDAFIDFPSNHHQPKFHQKFIDTLNRNQITINIES